MTTGWLGGLGNGIFVAHINNPPLTCNGVAKDVHLGSGQQRPWTLPSRIWIWKYSVMQALQYTCWHSLKQRQPEPSFSTKQIPHPKILLSNAFCLCASSKSRSWGRRSARGSNRGTARGSSRDDEDSWGSCLSFVTSGFFSEGSQRHPHWGSAKKKWLT